MSNKPGIVSYEQAMRPLLKETRRRKWEPLPQEALEALKKNVPMAR